MRAVSVTSPFQVHVMPKESKQSYSSGYNFTERTRKVLALARMEAARAEAASVDDSHVLLGLIVEAEGVAVAAMINLGLDLDEIADGMRSKSKNAEAGKSKRDDEVPFSRRAKKILEYAMGEARELGHSYVGTEHLLLGLLRVGDGESVAELARTRVTYETVRAEVLRLLGTESEAPAPDVAKDVEPPDERLSERAHTEAVERLRRQVSGFVSLNGLDRATNLVVLADLEVLPVDLIVELLAAFDMLHRALGGGGLEIEAQHVGSTPSAYVLA